MLSHLAELAKNTTAVPPEDNSAKKIEAPDWWKKMTPNGRDTYLRWHPKSKMTPFIQQEMKDRLKAHPEERKKLRGVVKEISKNPKEALSGDFEKLDKAKDRKISAQDSEEIDKSINDSTKKGKSKSILKGIGKALAIAGLLTLGAGLLATGGLPYAIITMRLITDTTTIAKEVHHRIKQGEDGFKAICNTVGNTIGKAARDPVILASALAIQQSKMNHKLNKLEEGKQNEKVTRAKMSGTDSTEDKTQSAPKQQKAPEKTKQKAPTPIKKKVQHSSNKINLDDEEGNA